MTTDMDPLSNVMTYEEFQEYKKTNRTIPKYDSAKEDKHPHIWWALDHQRLEAERRKLSESSLVHMNGIPDDDIELRHLRQTGEAIHKVKRTKTIRVALSGPQGAGKSSFLSSLLDCNGLCATGADGHACTNAMIRYVFYRGNSGAAFLAETTFLKAKKIREMIDEHSRAYYHFHHFDEELEEMAAQGAAQTKSRVRDEEDVKANRTAEDIFKTLFGGSSQFKDAWTTDRFRRGTFQKECERKCQETIAKLDTTTENTVRYFASNPIELGEKIKAFTTNVDGSISLWPLVDSIRYGLDRPLLEQGFEFWDLPGWGDINLAKSRHADEIKDSADLEIVLADTMRIATEATTIDSIRAGLQNRGAHNVLITTTKTDALDGVDLAQCKGESFNTVNALLQWVDDKVEEADAADDGIEEGKLREYRTYLQGRRKCIKIVERSQKIDQELEHKFEDLIGDDRVQVFHVASRRYTEWTSDEKIKFSNQPEIPVRLTGIPKIRSYLYHRSVGHNLEDLRNHMVNINSYIDKIERVVSDRNKYSGYKTLEAEFSVAKIRFIEEYKKGIRHLYDLTWKSVEKAIAVEMKNCRRKIDLRIQENWFTVSYFTYNKTLKGKGRILPGTSKAKGMGGGCDWNKELSLDLEPLFKQWKFQQHRATATLKTSLEPFFQTFYDHVHDRIRHSKSRVSAIETAKNKWTPYDSKMFSELDILVVDLTELLGVLLRRATMVDNRQNSLMPTITDALFEDVYRTCPALKPSSTHKKKAYVEPPYALQKKRMRELFLDPKRHILDKTWHRFRDLVKTRQDELLEKSVTSMNNTLQGFGQMLLELAPIEYEVTRKGESIRDALRNKLPALREQVGVIQGLLPVETIVLQDDSASQLSQNEGSQQFEDLTSFIDKVSASNNPFKATTTIKRERSSSMDEDSSFVSDMSMTKRRS